MIDRSDRPKPDSGETLDEYVDRYLTWLEAKVERIFEQHQGGAVGAEGVDER